MFRPHTTSVRQVRPARGRRGAILIVVLGLLTLFAILGISFVFTGTAEADGARIFKEQENQTAVVAPDATAAVRQFMQSLIYPVGDSAADATNVLRGHELLRSMYGGRGTTNVPYNGVGTFHEDMRGYGIPALSNANYPTTYLDRAHAINYTGMIIGTNGAMVNPQPWQVLLDPEVSQVREVPDANTGVLGPFQATTRATVKKNAPYTYADLKDLYLGIISPATGEVLVKSFHRDWLFNAQNPNPNYRLAPWNPNDQPASPINVSGTNTALNIDWITAEGRLKVLRPRPIDQFLPSELPAAFNPLPTAAQLATIPLAQQVILYNFLRDNIQAGTVLGYPQQNADTTFSGDHVNMPGGNGLHKADSILLDTGMAVIRLSDGRFVKPMASVLVTDQGGKVDLSSHGNLQYDDTTLMPRNPRHMSNQGVGRWEVNPGRIPGLNTQAIVAERQGTPRPLDVTGKPPVSTRAGISARYYDTTGIRHTTYGAVDWQVNSPVVTRPTLPSVPASTFQTVPTYTAPYEDNSTQAANHPSLFNPAEWGGSTLAASLKTFSPTNLRRMTSQFAPPLLDYANMTFPVDAGLVPNQSGNGYRLSSSHPMLGLVTTRQTSLDRPGLMPNYQRIDPGFALRQPGVTPVLNYPNTFITTFPDTTLTGLGTPTGDFGTQSTDVKWENIRAVLGPVDLNRRLADYRDPTAVGNQPPFIAPPGTLHRLSPDTVSPNTITQAMMDRQNFARDIFARLVIATGAAASVNTAGDVQVAATITTASDEFKALRYLAQLAANIVDYIDTDDVSTTFLWYPGAGAALTAYTDAATYVTTLNTASQGTRGDLLVYGVEKPRLTLNEAYCEIVNDPQENFGNGAPTRPAHVRFWVELMNPTNTPYPGGATATLLNNGAAQLKYEGTDSVSSLYSPYKLEITKAVRGGSNAAANMLLPNNVDGSLPPAHTPEISYDFSMNGGGLNPNRAVLPNNGLYNPNPTFPIGDARGGIVMVAGQALSGNSGISFQTPAAANWPNVILAPDAAAGLNQNAMNYQLPTPPNEGNGANELYGEVRRHMVLLRRLTNPYAPPNFPGSPNGYQPAQPWNGYVTVDYMDHVTAWDRLLKAGNSTMQRTERMGAGAGYEPTADRRSMVKVAPYAGYTNPTTAASNVQPVFSFPTSMVLASANVNGGNVGEPGNTFNRHNGQSATGVYPATGVSPLTIPGETLLAPYDWMVHFDRPLVNPLELLHVQAVKPHEVTQYSIRDGGAGTLDRKQGHPNWLPTTGATPTGAENGLLRALDLLRVQDRTYGTPHGGKVHGRININSIMHPSVFEALFDAQNGNGFTATQVYDPTNTTDDMWRKVICPPLNTMTNLPVPVVGRHYRTANVVTRTAVNPASPNLQVPVPGPSVHDINPNVSGPSAVAPFTPTFPYLQNVLDRPFLPLSAPQFAAPTAGTPAFAAPAGMGRTDTLLRDDETGNPALAVAGQTHDYFRLEAARKVLNNVTTTSETFAVSLTITFHEVRMSGSTQILDAFNRNLLGREIYKDIPGDLRQQFFAVIDRANVATQPNNAGSVVATPFYTTLETAHVVPAATMPAATTSVINIAGHDASGTGAGPFYVYSDGRQVTLAAGIPITVGVGANADTTMQVGTVAATATAGVLQVTLNELTAGSGTLQKPHAVGTSVSNANPGTGPGSGTGVATNPPSPAFVLPTPSDTRFTGMIPYFTRVR